MARTQKTAIVTGASKGIGTEFVFPSEWSFRIDREITKTRKQKVRIT